MENLFEFFGVEIFFLESKKYIFGGKKLSPFENIQNLSNIFPQLKTFFFNVNLFQYFFSTKKRKI